MQFGAMNFPIRPLLDEIEKCSRLGFDYVELAMDPPMAHYSILSKNLVAIREALEKFNLGLICHLPTFLSTADLTESIRQASVTEMYQSMVVASSLGAQKLVLHPSMVFGMGSFVPDMAKKYFFDFLEKMVAAAQKLNIIICLENMFPRNWLGVEVDDFEEIFNTFPTLQFTLDTGHANIDDKNGNRMMKFIDRFSEKIGHLHFSDNHGKRDDHLGIGLGSVNFPELVQRLKNINYDATITLEVFDSNLQNLVDSRDQIRSMFSK